MHKLINFNIFSKFYYIKSNFTILFLQKIREQEKSEQTEI